ncbi:MAG: hypothetical protein ABIJ20_04645 [Nanoarchaeota archaeon]|nr:hypothetical protein [Nanoarchaeota archaeon]MBU1445094.1 hypothetical protein [Nanoarchaeota archaeon]MBU2406551.1 hypothetical protein [Nanoarchaeota archaeon]MBU2420349.1 hypothetical protein [Nanoarchaeota archaeon]MBU2474957.1 hypothetical protein [Nanoarchaeota archaeon]
MRKRTLAGIIGTTLLAGALTLGSLGCAPLQHWGESLQIYPRLFNADTYEEKGDKEYDKEDKIAWYELSLNTLVYQGDCDEEQINRLCLKLHDGAGKLYRDDERVDCYESLSFTIIENFDEYHEQFSECGVFYGGELINLPSSLTEEEFESIPRGIRGDSYYTSRGPKGPRKIDSMYTPLPCISDAFSIVD